MGDALGDVCPCGAALGRYQRGDVVERHDEAVNPLAVALGHDPDQQSAAILATNKLDLVRHQGLRPCAGESQQLGHLGNRILQRAPGEVVHGRIEQRKRRRIGQRDPPVGVQPDDAGGDARQHRLGEAPPLVEFQVGALQGLLLAVDLTRHAIEGPAERADLVILRRLVDPCRQLACANAVGSGDEPADGVRDAVGKLESQPYGGKQDQEGDQYEDDDERNLNAESLFLQALIIPDHCLNLSRVINHFGLKGPRHVEIDVDEIGELDQPAHTVAGAGQDHELPLLRRIDGPVGNGLDLCGECRIVARDDVSVAAKHDRLGERERGRGVGQQSGHEMRRLRELLSPAVELHGRRQGADAQIVSLLLHVRLGDRLRALNRARHLLAEPGLHAEMEKERRKDGNHDRGRQGDETEERRHPYVQTCSGRSPAAFDPEPDQLRRHQRAEQEQQHEVDVEQDQDGLRIGSERRRAAHGGVGDRAAGQGRAGEPDGDPARQIPAPRPRHEALAQGAFPRTGSAAVGGLRCDQRFIGHCRSPRPRPSHEQAQPASSPPGGP